MTVVDYSYDIDSCTKIVYFSNNFIFHQKKLSYLVIKNYSKNKHNILLLNL